MSIPLTGASLLAYWKSTFSGLLNLRKLPALKEFMGLFAIDFDAWHHPGRRKSKGKSQKSGFEVEFSGSEALRAAQIALISLDGDRLVKSSKYIPKGKLERVQRLDNQKAPVREILKLLGVKL